VTKEETATSSAEVADVTAKKSNNNMATAPPLPKSAAAA
jgi:hypothetical protein